MPKPRKAKPNQSPNCSFCGHHKDDVPLLVTSNVDNAGVCTWCAIGVIEQTMKHAMGMEKELRKIHALMQPKAPATPKIEIVGAGTKPDKLDVAIGKALNGGK